MSTLAKVFKRENKAIGFVPTMGCLHEGHLSLIKAAKKHADLAVISIFVNPIQFGPEEDFHKYPRDLKKDELLARGAGADVLFYPSAEEMYPEDHMTYVNVEKITDALCGSSRPGHFKGVATVVTKLFNIVKPDIAYFGQKDAQQAFVIKKMAQDLNMGIDIKIMPIIREDDGLAMSSRNTYLSQEERKDAAVLYNSLIKAQELIAGGEKRPLEIIKVMKDMILAKKTAKIDYVSIVDTKNLKCVDKVSGELLIALAVYIGRTRLIDNIIVKIAG